MAKLSWQDGNWAAGWVSITNLLIEALRPLGLLSAGWNLTLFMDAYTLHIATAFASGMMTISLLGLYFACPREYSLLDWSMAGLLFLIAYSLQLATHFWPLPFWAVPALSNVFSLAGHCAILLGVRRYLGLKSHWGVLILLIVAVAMAHTLPWVQASVAHRLMLLVPLMLFINGLTLWLLWRYTARGDAVMLKIACLPLMLLELLFLLQMGIRSAIIMMSDMDIRLAEGGSQLIQTSGTLANFVYISFGTVALVLMVVRRQEISLQQLTVRDPITGWLNRRALADIATREFERSRRTTSPLGMLVMDIDYFKRVNDLYGHACGDEALKHLTHTCEQQLRGYDYLFRFGGEEFLVLLPQSDETMSRQLATRLRRSIETSRFEFGGESRAITVSIGVAQWRESDASWSAMFERADGAMYHAKQSGRNRVASEDGERFILCDD